MSAETESEMNAGQDVYLHACWTRYSHDGDSGSPGSGGEGINCGVGIKE